jgi:hypothetical protein
MTGLISFDPSQLLTEPLSDEPLGNGSVQANGSASSPDGAIAVLSHRYCRGNTSFAWAREPA